MRFGKLALLAGGVLAVLFVAGMPGLGQGVTEPSGEHGIVGGNGIQQFRNR